MLEMFQRVPAQHDESLIDSVLFLAQVIMVANLCREKYIFLNFQFFL